MIKIVCPKTKKYISPSQILSYRWCPRKFYFQYILGWKPKLNLSLVAGNIVHQAISDFLKQPHALDSKLESDHYEHLEKTLVKALNTRWWSSGPQFDRLDDSPAEIKKMYLKCRKMIRNYFEHFYIRVMEQYDICGDWNMAVVRAKPKSEITIRSDEHKLYARIDQIDDSGKIIITDYKTSSRRQLTPAIRIQLGLCALAYIDRFGKRPDIVQANFLAFEDGIESIEVTDSLLEEARMAIDQHKMLTQSENIKDYPCLCGGYCEKDFQDQNDADR